MPKTASTAPNPSNLAAQIVERASTAGRHVIDGIDYLASTNTLVIKCGPLALSIDASSISELAGISRDDLTDLTLSAGGATLKLDKREIYIEVVSLVVEIIEQMSRRGTGGLIMDVIEHSNFAKA